MQRIITIMVAVTFVLVAPASVLAHSGSHPTPHGGLTPGALHPLLGPDHLLAMLAVGIWAVQLGGRARWIVPIAFVGCMSVGGVLPALGVGALMVESVVLVSILVLGLLLSSAWRLPVALGAMLAGAFALCHGAAHVAEMPTNVSAVSYLIGFIAATATLHLLGMTLAFLPRGAHRPLTRVCGGALVAAGFLLVTASLY